MTIDLIFVGVMMAFGLLGWLSGFWMQAMRLGVLIVSYLLAGVIGRPLGGALAEGFSIPLLLGQAMGTFVAFLGLYLVLSTVGWSILRRRRRNKDQEEVARRRTWDSMVGCAFGMAKAGLIMYLLLSALTLMEARLAGPIRRAEVGYDSSLMVKVAREHNLLKSLHLPVVGDIEALERLSSDPAFREKVARDPAVQRLLLNPKIKGLLGDRALVNASKGRDVSAMMANPQLNKALEDPEVRKLLGEIDLSKIE